MIGSPAPQSPPLRLYRAAPRQAARPVRPGHRPAAAMTPATGTSPATTMPSSPRPAARRHSRAVATSRAGHQRQLPARARSGEHGHGVLATSAPRPASVMPAGTACGDRTHRSARAAIKQAGATRSHCLLR